MESQSKLLPIDSQLKIDIRGRSLEVETNTETFQHSEGTGQITNNVNPSSEFIIGIAVGCTLAFLLGIVIVYSCIRRVRHQRKLKECERGRNVPQVVIEHATPNGSAFSHAGSRPLNISQHGFTHDGTESEYGSVGGSPPESPTPSLKSAKSTFDIDRSRPGSFASINSLGSSYGSARSHVSRKSRATIASFKSALEE
ncbi:uncharacterized protein LOC136038007 [Artemia franciscana]|uniref:uncharacterized protein LOC136038007 n=1 Tax=Artemia franciscana TaxID=6661 RepID=UPI0032DB3E4E